MKTKNLYRTDLLPEQEVGPYETGCHTQWGNDLCLLVASTPSLADKMHSILEGTWKRETLWDFDSGAFPLLRSMENSSRLLLCEANAVHHLSEDDLQEDTFNDFFLWMIRGYADLKAEQFQQANSVLNVAK